MAAFSAPLLTPEQYLELDRRAERRSEFHDGQMFPIEASTLSHVRIQGNLYRALRDVLTESSPCEVLMSSLRVRIPLNKGYTYPDLIVACGKLELEDNEQDTLTNPTVLFEVLSPSTAGFDSGEKFRLYRSLPSFKEYVLVSQNRVLVEHYLREGTRNWRFEVITELDATLRLSSISVDIPMREIYQRIDLAPLTSS